MTNVGNMNKEHFSRVATVLRSEGDSWYEHFFPPEKCTISESNAETFALVVVQLAAETQIGILRADICIS